MNGDQILTLPEVAGILKVHEKTVRRIIERGELVRFKVGGQVRVMLSALNAYIEKQVRDTGTK